MDAVIDMADTDPLLTDKPADKPRPPRPRRRPLYLALLFTPLVLLAAHYARDPYHLWSQRDALRYPYKQVWEGATPGADSVVPLLGPEKFDIALVVWARVPDAHTPHPEWYQDEFTPGVLARRVASRTGIPPVEAEVLPYEIPVFSAVVLANFSLSDPPREVDVTFDLPLARFHDRRLWPGDVRAAVGIIPHTPFTARISGMHPAHDRGMARLPRLDENVNPPGRPYVFRTVANATAEPGGKLREWTYLDPNATHRGTPWSGNLTGGSLFNLTRLARPSALRNRTSFRASSGPPAFSAFTEQLEHRIREDVAITFPLLHLHAEGAGDRFFTDPTRDPFLPPPATDAAAHPYLFTRGVVFIANQTRPLKKNEWAGLWGRNKEFACGKRTVGAPGSRWLCGAERYYPAGHWRTAYNVKAPRGQMQIFNGTRPREKRIERYAYSPYIKEAPLGPGRRHVYRLPVNRSLAAIPDDAPSSARVNFTLRVESLDPGDIALHEYFAQSLAFLARGRAVSEKQLKLEDNMWDVHAGLAGSPRPGTHPWRRFVVGGVLPIILHGAELLLMYMYWWTRRTSAGISTVAPWLLLADVADRTRRISRTNFPQTASWVSYILVPWMLQIRTVAPWVAQRTGWRVTLRRRAWTHRERASLRRELPLRPTALLLVALTALIGATHYRPLWLLAPMYEHVPLRPSALVRDCVTYACSVSAHMLQVYLNHASGTFAGEYACASVVSLADDIVHLVYRTRWIGEYDAARGFTLVSVVRVGPHLALVYQAFTLPRVEQEEPDDE